MRHSYPFFRGKQKHGLWCSLVETVIKTIPMEKKCKKAKWLAGEALQIAVKRREAKSKGEEERYKHLNAEFQRITRRDKKAFFSDQRKEKEDNNRMGNTRDLFKKIRDTKWTKLVEVMEFQLSYFKSWKMMLWKCCTQYASKFGKLSSAHRTGKGQFSFQSQRKAMPKNVQTTPQLHWCHTLAK